MTRALQSLFIAAAFLSQLTTAAAAAESTSVQRGRDLVQRNCAMCHATGATGDSPLPAAPRLRELYLRYPVENLAEAMVEGILVGHPQMPEFLFFSWETNDIINYLKSIQTRQPAALPRVSPSPSGGRRVPVQP